MLVIGGGATGAGCTLDAASRGLKCAMVERADFGAGTSSRSTKLIHGGVRYLEKAFLQLDLAAFNLVREALAERAHMLAAAPHMAKPLPILIPINTWWEIPYMWVGTKVYDLIAGFDSGVPSSFFITKDEALFRFPMLNPDKLKGGIVYYDGQMNDTRYNLSIALTAVQWGATVANRVEVVSFIKNDEGKCAGARVRDTLTEETWDIRAKSVVNATGPFSDKLRKMNDPSCEELMVPAAGVHVILGDHFSPDQMGLIVPKTADGRVLFFLPWENMTLCGTTDSAADVSMRPKPTKEEVDFIIRESARYLSRPIKPEDVRAAWCGIRPLVRDPKATGTAAISREHVVDVSQTGLVSICGGKWTTYRKMAEDAIDAVLAGNPEIAPQQPKCQTKNLSLIGADRAGIVCGGKFDRIVVTLREEYGFDRSLSEHLVSEYGTRALQIAQIVKAQDKNNLKRLNPRYPFLVAEVEFAVEQEYALTTVDVLARRTRLAFLDSKSAREAAPLVIKVMGDKLKWDDRRKQEEAKDVEEFLETMSLPNLN